ncbi:hypothetical protein [Sulfitobacter sp. R18_1]|uniref:hypothetical protein n=1 Tax=Sulfitobacter sp. R18_1 TaxID=2821104 RepID=UPI001ADC3ACD|nr:hypothetical protein [Sulfitobacter sp. R18_1]MBO9428853.1 hypothetical protein [Sulfitobacter sp. R18_1]
MPKYHGKRTLAYDVTWDLEPLHGKMEGYALLRRKVAVSAGGKPMEPHSLAIGFLTPQGYELFLSEEGKRARNYYNRNPRGFSPLNYLGCYSGYAILTADERKKMLEEGPNGYRDLSKQKDSLFEHDNKDGYQSIYMTPDLDLYDAYLNGEWSEEDVIYVDQAFLCLTDVFGNVLPTRIDFTFHQIMSAYDATDTLSQHRFEFLLRDNSMLPNSVAPSKLRVLRNDFSSLLQISFLPDDSDMAKVTDYLKEKWEQTSLQPSTISSIDLRGAVLKMDLMGLGSLLSPEAIAPKN